MKLSPQKEQILAVLRDKEWHCSSEFGYIKDDRKRISELNEGYMREKGYEIVGKPCDGRCGKNHSSGLYMRKAVELKSALTRSILPIPSTSPLSLVEAQDSWFESLK